MKPKKICLECGTEFTPTGTTQKFCAEKCFYKAKNKKKRLDLPERACDQCGTPFKPKLRRQRFCSYGCATKNHNSKISAKRVNEKQNRAAKPRPPKDAATAAPLPANADLVCRILSDTIHSGSIADELALLGQYKKPATAGLRARLSAELAGSPVWPTGVAGRAALALWLLDHPTPARWRHPHERIQSGYPKPTMRQIKSGLRR